MSSIDPKSPVTEIQQQHPETVEVFRSFNMKCADNSYYADKTLEENFVIERVDFIELLNALSKAIQPQKTNDEPIKESDSKTKGIAGIGKVLSEHTSLDEKFSWWILLLLLLPIIGWLILPGYLIYFGVRPHYKVIVGSEGFAVYRISKRNRETFSPIFYYFKDMTDLKFPKTDNYTNGIYSGTSYKFRLLNNDSTVYSKSGKYRKSKKKISDWKFSFLCSIENAWTLYFLQRQSGTAIRFETSKEPIEIGNSYLKYKDVTFHRHEIKRYWFEMGMLFIEHANFESKFAGFKTHGDRMVVPVNDMLNQKAFLVALGNMFS